MSTPRALAAADSLYMLMFAGWKAEMRSNRWHYARRWARHVPVVLIQPDQHKWRLGDVEPEPRIPNCSILHVRQVSSTRSHQLYAEHMIAQIAQHMLVSGHQRPVLWAYNPWLFTALAALPAVARVFHATENYFEFELDDPLFMPLLREALALADPVIAASSGVVETYRREVPGARVVEVTNGCDYAEYAGARPAPRLAAERARWSRIAIYAGNVNARLDLALLERVAAADPRTLLALFGPLGRLDAAQVPQWEALLRHGNVRHFGAVDPSELPGLYAAADVGLIPYVRTPMIENSGFPLKALEMTATGLPVVTTYMRPLEAIEGVVRMARDPDAFLAHYTVTSRGTLTADQRAAMDATARAGDYDRAFEAALEAMSSGTLDAPVSRLDLAARTFGAQRVLSDLVRMGEPCASSMERCLRGAGTSALRRARGLVDARLNRNRT